MLLLSSQRSRISTPANHAAVTLGSRLMKTSKSGGNHFLIIGISLVTGIVLLVNGWILSAGSVFENRAFSIFIKKQMNQVKLRPPVGAH